MPTDNALRDFFLKPVVPRHRRYEILRARFVDNQPVPIIARQFGVTYFTAQSLIRDFKNDFENQTNEQFFMEPAPGPKTDRKKPIIKEHVIRLRAHGYASTDIYKALHLGRYAVSLSLIDHVLREEGLSGLPKRSKQQRQQIAQEIQSQQIPGLTIPLPAVAQIPEVADVGKLDLHQERIIHTPNAGIFLFIPFLVQAGINTIVSNANMVGTSMIPAISYLLSLLHLKLLDKERKSHITDWSFDPGSGLWAGLNYLPKTTAITDYSYRLTDNQHNKLLMHWVKSVYPILCPDGASCFAIDFHSIPHRSKEPELENHYVPSKGKAMPAVLACFARSIDSPMLCYANADITNKEKAGMVVQFVQYWEKITGVKPDWLYFDSKMTTYQELNNLNCDPDKKINFITIRRRGSSMVNKILATADSQWQGAVIDTPQRRHQKIKLLDTKVKLSGYEGLCRQIAVTGLGRALPTLFLSNNEEITGRDVVVRYIKRNYIENDIGINVNFFHLDCLASQVRLNVNLDVVITAIANGCYRWLSQKLKGCEKMEPKQVYRKFVDTAGNISITDDTIDVCLDRRAHNPVLAQACIDAQSVRIPWLGNKKLQLFYA